MTEHCFNVRDVGFDPGNIHPMLVHCEPIVSDTGPILYQHWVNVSCLLGCIILLPSRSVMKNERLLLCWGYGVRGSGPAINQCSHCEHVFYLLISPPPPPLIPYTLGAFSQRWGNVLKRT